MQEYKLLAQRGWHNHNEQHLPYHVGKVVNKIRQAAAADI
jgi:hypothetical protein